MVFKMEYEGLWESNKKVFLGGVCNGSKWRDKLIPMLKINYFAFFLYKVLLIVQKTHLYYQ